MASRIGTYYVKCPPKNATQPEKDAYARMFRAVPVASALFEGDFALRITRLPGGLTRAAARKRAASRKRR
jgi:hypothetical protein